jgi:hypothetical protein
LKAKKEKETQGGQQKSKSRENNFGGEVRDTSYLRGKHLTARRFPGNDQLLE